MHSDRRTFLAAAAAGIFSTKALGLSQTLAVRKDVNDSAAAADIAALKVGIEKMRDPAALPEGDKRRYAAQAAMHGAMGTFTDCQHGNWYFPAWHRAYLYYFEEIIRELSGVNAFALPYWNWTKDPRIPDSFWGEGNPLTHANRRPEAQQGQSISQPNYIRYVSSTVVSRIRAIEDFELFGGFEGDLNSTVRQGELESQPHNFIHRWVGGDMVTAASPLDPIFWLHHCNIDRLWVEWARTNPGSTPTSRAWLDQTFASFVARNGQPDTMPMTVERTLSTANLGYRYDTRPEPIAVAPRAARAEVREGARLVVGAVDDDPSVDVATFAATSTFANMLNKVVDETSGSRKTSVRLSIKGVQQPEGDVGIDVFLNCQRLTKDTPISDPSFVGSITFFTTHGHNRDGGVNFALDLTSDVVRLYGDRPLKADEPLKVGLVYRPLFGDGPPHVKSLSPDQVSITTATRG